MWFTLHQWLGLAGILAATNFRQPTPTADASGSVAMLSVLNIIAIIVGPLSAVLITVWWQRRWEQHKEKHDAKLRLFLTLMADRKSSPETYEWVRALNLIDVVFADDDRVTVLWHELYDLINTVSTPEARDNKLVELLSEMAKVLGFEKLQQISIGKFLCPQVHKNQLKMRDDTKAEMLRVLKSTGRILTEPREDEDKADV